MLIFKREMGVICDFLLDPNEKNPFEKEGHEKQLEKNEWDIPFITGCFF